MNSTMQNSRPVSGHDHSKCIKKAIAGAIDICDKQGFRLTRLRKQVLELIWQSHKPLGAYILMDMLQSSSDRTRVAPPTVYRALDFLLEAGLIHKVHSLNAYVGRQNPNQNSNTEALFICGECNHTEEVLSQSIQQAINLSASQHRFNVNAQIVEITGLCNRCKRGNHGQQ